MWAVFTLIKLTLVDFVLFKMCLESTQTQGIHPSTKQFDKRWTL